MTWLVFGVSCLLVLAGAASVISGAPIIQLERGWAEVIAGTMALSSGGVVFALAVILMRVEALRDMMAARASGADPADVVKSESPDLAIDPLPIAVVAEETTASSPEREAETPASEDSASGQGLWKRVRRPSDDLAPPVLDQGGLLERVTSTDTPKTFQPTVTVEQDDRPVASPEPISPAPIEEPAANTKAEEPEQLGWLERSLFKGRPPKPRPDLPSAMLEPVAENPFIAPTASHHTRIEPSLDRRAEPPADAARPQELGETPASPVAPLLPASTTSAEAETPEDGVTVIGRYQAGVASYVMYSDGTIEVETEGGEVHRFGSMDELKAFIAVQDKALS